jgi:hypothetical protein
LSRRSLLAISAAAAAAAATVGAPGAVGQAATADDPDAFLLDLCAQWEAHRREYDNACAALERAEVDAFDRHSDPDWPMTVRKVDADPAYRAADARCLSLIDRSHDPFQAIGKARATTLKGLMAKARITASQCLEEGGIE